MRGKYNFFLRKSNKCEHAPAVFNHWNIDDALVMSKLIKQVKLPLMLKPGGRNTLQTGFVELFFSENELRTANENYGVF